MRPKGARGERRGASRDARLTTGNGRADARGSARRAAKGENMSRVAYVNGRYVRHADAAVSIDDRAFLFADGIYEVVEIFGGKLIDEDGHLERLTRSAAELRLKPPVGE